MSRDQLLQRISALDFYLIDLHLYLNTHPDCQDALNKYNALVLEANELKKEYVQLYGMLCMNGSPSGYPWQWIDNPWPWQYEFNFKLAGDE